MTKTPSFFLLRRITAHIKNVKTNRKLIISAQSVRLRHNKIGVKKRRETASSSIVPDCGGAAAEVRTHYHPHWSLLFFYCNPKQPQQGKKKKSIQSDLFSSRHPVTKKTLCYDSNTERNQPPLWYNWRPSISKPCTSSNERIIIIVILTYKNISVEWRMDIAIKA